MSRPGQIRFLSRVAALYDPVVRAMGFRPLWNALAECAAGAATGPCLDVCTGTGGVALALARSRPEVVGVDLAEGMLAQARHKASRDGLATRVRWIRADARKLSFPDGSFPAVTCSMALHEMAEPERRGVLGELARVSGGRIWIADYRVPSSGWRAVAFRATRAFEYLESDDFGSFTGHDFPARLRAAGLAVGAADDVGPYRIWSCQVGTA